jgi:hypothetical protein
MSVGAMPTGGGPCPSCPLSIAPLGGGGAMVASAPYGACLTVMGQQQSLHAAYITTYIETGIHDGLGTVFGTHGQGPGDTPSCSCLLRSLDHPLPADHRSAVVQR